MRNLGFLLIPVALLSLASAASAQDTGEIGGRVTDASGAVLPGVLVTLTSPVLLQAATATTSETGSYRFPRLSIGTYNIAFELAGFSRVLRENIEVEIGFTALVNATLQIPGIEETVTVAAAIPIVDTRDSSRGGRFTRDALDSVPTARDPWVIIGQTPSVLMAAVNVGGNQSGIQVPYASRGASYWTSRWMLDGIDITDIAANGGSSIYYDFDSFQEMQVTTGGGDTTQQSAGVGVNIVTRSGTDAFRGSGRFFVTDDALEAQNVTQELRAQNAGAGNPIQNIKDYGIEAGGPIRRGRAWIWGSYGLQDIKVGILNYYKKTGECAGITGSTAINYPMDTVRGCLQPDLTNIWAVSLKAQVQLFPGNKVSWFNNFTEKTRPTREASDLRPIETTYRQAAMPRRYGAYLWNTGPASIWKAGDQYAVNDRWLVEAQWAHQGNNFAQDFHEDSLADVQPRYEIITGAWSRSYQASYNLRPTNSVTVATEFFVPAWLGGDHAFKAGYRWRAGTGWNEQRVGGSTVARYQNGIAAQADLYRTGIVEYGFTSQGAWFQDTYTRKKLTLNLGLRLDSQRDRARASGAAAHPFQGQMTAQGEPFKWLPAVTFDGADPGPTWNDLSPRIGAAYDLAANGRTVLRASVARYYGPSAAGWTSTVVNPVTVATVRFPWSDANSDGFVQVTELDTTRILASSGNYDPANPTALGTKNTVDPGFRNYATDEIILGVDHEVGAEFAVGASYMWRRVTNDGYYDTVGLTSADYVQRTYTPPASLCPVAGARCETVTYWEPAIPLPSTVVETNRPDYERRYHGFELTARKRFRHGWLLDGSAAFNLPREHFRSAASYEDPTNIDKVNGGSTGIDPGVGPAIAAGYATAVLHTDGGVVPTMFVNAKWTVKASGAYTLPWWSVGVSGAYQARQGYPFPQAVQTPSRANAAGIILVLLDRMGDVRLPTLQTLDLGVSKPFRLGPAKITASVDVFNVANVNTVLLRQRIQNAPNANQVRTIVAPRVARLGARVEW